MMSKKLKHILLVVLIIIVVAILAQLFLWVRYHYTHSAKTDDDEGLKTLAADIYSETSPKMEIVEFRKIYKSAEKKIMAVNFVSQKNPKMYSQSDNEPFGYYFCLTPDNLFKNRYCVGGGSGAGGEDLNELVADSQTYYDSKLRKDIECVAIRGVKLENIGAKFTIPELDYSGTITSDDYFDIIIIEDSNLARSFDIQFEK